MSRQLESGHYKVRREEDTPPREPPRDWRVARGSVINESSREELGRHMGMSSSKWYTFTSTEYLRQYDDRSGTGVLMVADMKCEHNTKRAAQRSAHKGYCVDE